MVLSPSTGGYWFGAGTSQAAPHVAGVAALIIEANGGSMHPSHVKEALLESSDDLGKPGNDDYYGQGRVNAYNAVSSGLLKRVVPEGDMQIAAVPVKFELSQNYPNPFNPSTTINYSIPLESRVTLKIYSIDGRLVRTLDEGVKSAGAYDVVWDGRDDSGQSVVSGTYIYKITAGSYQKTCKMVLMR